MRLVLTWAHRCPWSPGSLAWSILVPVTFLMIRKLWVSKTFSAQLNCQKHWCYASESLSLFVFFGKRRIKAFFFPIKNTLWKKVTLDHDSKETSLCVFFQYYWKLHKRSKIPKSFIFAWKKKKDISIHLGKTFCCPFKTNSIHDFFVNYLDFALCSEVEPIENTLSNNRFWWKNKKQNFILSLQQQYSRTCF